MQSAKALVVGDPADTTTQVGPLARTDARLPFGGTKKSGYGRELAAGVREFCNIRTYGAIAAS